MAVEELNKPLGLTPRRRTFPRIRYPYVAVGATVVLLAVAAWLALPKGEGPIATAAIEPPAPAQPAGPPAGANVALESTATISEAPGMSEVAPTGTLTEVGDVVIHDGSDEAPIRLAALPDTGLVEETPDGPLPQIGADGTRPLDAYARPTSGNSGPRIAIIVGGIGLDSAATAEAIQSLSGNVTLAFAPYGENLSGDLAAARDKGHEILLQIPLEPFNYPKTDPGPHTLTAEAKASENISRLHWFLTRITNYVGVVNYMGGRFTGEERALKPVMDELGTRGLLYVDDGSSPRSKAGAVANGVAPFVAADLVLDADLSAAAIDEQLRRLTVIARERGQAVATATAFPVTVERIAAFVAQAKSRGVTIVPVSALAGTRL
jgi:polysaccharide deacetylase 2 family uncharacterized protein YibQ